MANETTVETTESGNEYYETSLAGDSSGAFAFGNNAILGTIKGAVRIDAVSIPQGSSVNYARLYVPATSQGTGTGSDSLKTRIYGIDEDNTSSFGSNPFGRSKTTATNTQDNSLPGVGNYISWDVSSIVQEIVGRGGWSSGNAMGFFIEDNTSTVDFWMSNADGSSLLLYRLDAEPDFTPTPSTISAPTFPTAGDYGIKVSQPGVEVLTATDGQSFFTTRKQTVKVASEGDVSTSTGIYNVAHSLGYVPAVMGFMKNGGNRYKLNKYGGTPSGYIGADGTSVVIFSAAGTSVYYYEFIDPLA